MPNNMKSSLLLLFLLVILSSAVPISVNAAWSADMQLTENSVQDFFPSVKQLNNGNVWVTWQQGIPSTSTNICYRVFNGTTWLAVKALPKGFHQFSERTTPFLVQTRNGTVWLFYSEKNMSVASPYYDIVYKQTNNYGLSWSQTGRVTDSFYVPSDRYDNMAPSVVEALNGDIWVFWQRNVLPGPPPHGEIFYKILHGNSWSSEFQLTNFPSYVSINNPSVVQAKNNAILVFWSADVNSNNYEIKYQVYDGVSWGSVKALTSSTQDLDSDPAAALARTGDIWVVWGLVESTNDTAGDLFYKTSQDNGNTWSSQTKLTFDGTSEMASVTQVDDKRIWVAWTSNRNGNYELYYKTSDQLLYHDVAIGDISLSDASIYKGANVQVTVDAVNKGDFPETLTVKCYFNQTLIGTQTTSLLGGDSAALTFSWATSTYALGRYLIRATVDQVPSESSINLGDNSLTKGPILLRIPGDINADGRVSVEDLTRLNFVLGARPGLPNWDQECDINENNIIDVKDLYILGSNYG